MFVACMAIDLLAKLPKKGLFSSLGTRTKHLLLFVAFVVFYVLGVGYHLTIFSTQTPPSFGVALVYNLVILACYGTLWLLLSSQFKERQATPIRIFWTTLVLGIFLLGIALGISQIGRVPGMDSAAGFDYETDVPLTLATVVKMNLLSLLEATFFFIVLLRFRDLVLFKRTRSSQRNWYLMLGFILLAALTTFMKPPRQDEIGFIQALTFLPAMAFMVINSFRLSWIVHLSFKEKMVVIGLSTLLLALLATSLGAGGDSLRRYGSQLYQ